MIIIITISQTKFRNILVVLFYVLHVYDCFCTIRKNLVFGRFVPIMIKREVKCDNPEFIYVRTGMFDLTP